MMVSYSSIGLEKALADKNMLQMFLLLLDQIMMKKTLVATAEYFVELDYSLIGSILNIPKVKLKNEPAFEAFNFYRSAAWKIRS